MTSLSAVRRALVPRSPQRPAPVQVQDRSAQFIEIVRQVAKMNRKSYLELVPAEHRDHVIGEADIAFPTKGAGRTKEEFRELMALKWLAQKETFEAYSREIGFRAVNRASSSLDDGILALTKSGSLIALAQPDARLGQRDIRYGRIEEREDKSIPKSSIGFLKGQVMIGQRLETTQFSSSPVIALAAKEGAGREEMKRSFLDMRRTLNTIGNTIFVLRDA